MYHEFLEFIVRMAMQVFPEETELVKTVYEFLVLIYTKEAIDKVKDSDEDISL